MSASTSVSAASKSTSTCKSVRTNDVDNLFLSPSGSKLSINSEAETNKICCEELSNILEDCFLEDDANDTGKPIEEFYKDGVMKGLVPKNKKTQQKYEKYQNDYLEYCSDLSMNPSGKENSQFTLCNYFHDRQVASISSKIFISNLSTDLKVKNSQLQQCGVGTLQLIRTSRQSMM